MADDAAAGVGPNQTIKIKTKQNFEFQFIPRLANGIPIFLLRS